MDFLRLILKNAGRNRRRTFLTVVSVAVSIFLLASLRTLVDELGGDSMVSRDSALRLITRSAVSMQIPLPLSHQQKIAAIPGVVWTSAYQWFPTYYRDPDNIFVVFAIDPEVAGRDPAYTYSGPDVIAQFRRDRDSVVVPEKMMKRFGWKIGDRITFVSSIFPFNLDCVVKGWYSGPSEGSPLVRYDYFNEITKHVLPSRADRVTSFWTMVDRAENVPRVIQQIDGMFENTDAPTRTETEKGFILGFTAMLGNVKLFIGMIALAVVFAIVLVTANTMAMAVRERTTEIAVLKTIGFRRIHVFVLLLGESILISLFGAILGLAGVKIFFSTVDIYQMTSGVVQHFDIRSQTLVIGIAVGAGMGLVSGFLPTLRASGQSIATAMRQV